MHEEFLRAAERRRLTEAHTAETLHRVERLPSLEELVAHLDPKPPRSQEPTVEELRKVASQFIRAIGGEDRTVPQDASKEVTAPC